MARTATAMATSTTDPALALFAWLSPAYPVGAFAYSHGLEWAIEAGDVRDGASLAAWLGALVQYGSGRNDAILFACAWRAVNESGDLASLAELAVALSPSQERRLESVQQGAAFLAATRAAWPCARLDDVIAQVGAHTAYAVCFGASAAAHGLPLRPALEGFVAAFGASLVSAAVRLSVIGQTEGQAIVARLAPLASAAAAHAQDAGPDDLGGCALRADLASIHHETQYSRLFRS
ncbi:MAG: urease accessory protein UreF [Hyphomicrobiales bacterium]|nr:urease accessory protein UreF [Hyphomicrobiales bacterium]